VIDPGAVILAKEAGISIRVFNFLKEAALPDAIGGHEIGTLVHP